MARWRPEKEQLMSEDVILERSMGSTRAAENNLRWVVGLIILATIAVFSNMYITQPVLPVIGQEFGLTPAEAGLTVSSLVLAIAASSIFYGVLSDRVGRKPVMVASVLGLSIPSLLCALAPGFGWLIAFRVGQGLLIPGFTAITITYLQEEIPAERRGMVLSYYVSASVAGGFFGRLAGGFITELAGSWRVAFICFAMLDLGLAWALWRLLPVSRHFAHAIEATTLVAQTDGPVIAARFSPAMLLVHLRNRPLLGVYLVGFSLMYSFLGLFTYLPYYLSRPPFGLSTLLISSVYVVYLIGIFSSPLSARLAPRLGRRGVLLRGFGLMITGVGLTLLSTLPTVLLGLVILCFGMFACQSAATALVGESVKAGSGRGSAVALYQMFFYVGAGCGGFVPGLLWQMGGWPPVVGGVMAVLLLGLGAVIWLCREPGH